MRRFVQDTYQWGPLSLTMAGMLLTSPLVILRVVGQVRLPCMHQCRFCSAHLLDTLCRWLLQHTAAVLTLSSPHSPGLLALAHAPAMSLYGPCSIAGKLCCMCLQVTCQWPWHGGLSFAQHAASHA